MGLRGTARGTLAPPGGCLFALAEVHGAASGFAIGFSGSEVLALVSLLFALRDPEFHLHVSVLPVER